MKNEGIISETDMNILKQRLCVKDSQRDSEALSMDEEALENESDPTSSEDDEEDCIPCQYPTITGLLPKLKDILEDMAFFPDNLMRGPRNEDGTRKQIRSVQKGEKIKAFNFDLTDDGDPYSQLVTKKELDYCRRTLGRIYYNFSQVLQVRPDEYPNNSKH